MNILKTNLNGFGILFSRLNVYLSIKHFIDIVFYELCLLSFSVAVS